MAAIAADENVGIGFKHRREDSIVCWISAQLIGCRGSWDRHSGELVEEGLQALKYLRAQRELHDEDAFEFHQDEIGQYQLDYTLGGDIEHAARWTVRDGSGD